MKYPYFLKKNIMRIVIRIVIVFFKYNTIYIFRSGLLFYRQLNSGKYHPVVALLHNHKWLKKISKKVSSGFETVQCILSSRLCPSIFREILKYAWRHCNGSPLLCPINATYSSCCVFRHYSIQQYFIVE